MSSPIRPDASSPKLPESKGDQDADAEWGRDSTHQESEMSTIESSDSAASESVEPLEGPLSPEAEPDAADDNPAVPSLSPEQRQQRVDWLIDQFHGLVFSYAIRLAGNRADAEDLAQHTFLTAQEKLEQLRDPAKSKSWLLTICRNRFLKERRRKRPVSASTRDMSLDEVPENVKPDLGFDQEKLAMVIETMPDDHRVILMMFYFEELSYREIAEELDLKIGTVMSRLSRAKGRLRSLLLDGDNEDD